MNKLIFVFLLLFPVSCFSQDWTNTELVAAIENAVATGDTVKLPKKTVLTGTVDIGRLSGFHIKGSSNSFFSTPDAIDGTCQIVWEGPADVPIFKLSGSGVWFEGFKIVGNTPFKTVFQFVDQRGFADGKSYIDKVSVSDAKSKFDFIVCGESVGDAHCDTLTVSNCRVSGAANFFLSRNNQSMGHYFVSPHTVNCDTVFNLQAGGAILVDGVWTAIKCRELIRVKGQGKNNGDIKVEYLKVDSQTSELPTFKLVVSEGNPSCQVTFDGGIFPHLVSSKWTLSDMLSLSAGVKVNSNIRNVQAFQE